MSRPLLNALELLLRAVEHARYASARTQRLVREAIARFRALVTIERVRG